MISYTLPKIGDQVKVETKFGTHVGTVIPNIGWEEPTVFRIKTDKILMKGNFENPVLNNGRNATKNLSYHTDPHIALIDILNVKNIRYTDRDEEIEKKDINIPSSLEREISGSKPGSTYVVSFKNNNWACTCSGFGFRRSCRHVNEVKKEMP